MYFNLVRQGIPPTDIKFLYYSDAGLDIYGNAILASKKMLESNPKAVRGFIAATAKVGATPSPTPRPPSPRSRSARASSTKPWRRRSCNG